MTTYTKLTRATDGASILVNPAQVRCVTQDDPSDNVCRIYFDDSSKAMPVLGDLEEIGRKLRHGAE